ncbi:MAG: hypothetical protein DDT32_01613 [Syntrophomonadaceae bacterium]|nr:hypothetical protein [Bacillota bacterium]MBT9147847.1 hypothetical protein [Bacillota bacterium]
MEGCYLRYKAKISLKKSIEKISVHARWGDHRYEPRPTTNLEVAKLLVSLGSDPNRVAEECRDYRVPVPCFENLIESTWNVSGTGKFELIDTTTGEVLDGVQGPGTIAMSTYMALFEAACRARDHAVENASYTDLQSAAVQGIASIEACIVELVRLWNQFNPNDQLIDSKHSKVSLDDKFDVWVPKMSGGAKLIKGEQHWSDFTKLRKVRDHVAVHPKVAGQAIAYAELANLINAFRLGIGGMLGHIHRHFGQIVPSRVINAVYMPDVELVDQAAGF